MRITPHPAKTLIWWYNRRNSIDMNPSYQRRGRLWSPSDKAYLIDSIVNNFDVPKLYFADFQLGDSALNTTKMPFAIIDGKQRLEAIFDFFDNKLVLNGDFVWRADRHLKLGGLSLKDLRSRYAAVAESFENETIDIMSVVTDNVEDINELFVRLNRSKPLTGAEIRNAMVGPVPDVIRNVAGHPFFLVNIKFSSQRAGDYNAAAKLVFFEYEGRPTGTKKTDLDEFAGGRKEETSKRQRAVVHELLELAARRTIDVLDKMAVVFLPKDELLSSAGPIPVYYWLVRETKTEYQAALREFLLSFEGERKKNRQRQINRQEPTADEALGDNPVYSRYDTLNRSVNDVGSHVSRFEILTSEFQKWRVRQHMPLRADAIPKR